MSERFERGPEIYHMKCDICGKKEDIVNKDPYMENWWCRRHWSKLTYEFTGKLLYVGTKRVARNLTLCSECNKKLRKLIKNVDLGEGEE